MINRKGHKRAQRLLLLNETFAYSLCSLRFFGSTGRCVCSLSRTKLQYFNIALSRINPSDLETYILLQETARRRFFFSETND